MSQNHRHWLDNRPFSELIESFLDACPGPFLAAKGLRLMAYQRIDGVPGLEATNMDLVRPGRSPWLGRQRYVRSVVEVAGLVRVRPGYLSQSALRRGYQYSKAIRWIRFLHGVALYEQGIRNDIMARRLGFNDPAGWTRFVEALIGDVPTRLPLLPLPAWVARAIGDVYGAEPASSGGYAKREMATKKLSLHGSSVAVRD